MKKSIGVNNFKNTYVLLIRVEIRMGKNTITIIKISFIGIILILSILLSHTSYISYASDIASYTVYGYVEYNNSLPIPNGIPVNFTNLRNENTHVWETILDENNNIPGYYFAGDIYAIDGTVEGDIISISMSYGGCVGNETFTAGDKGGERVDITICCNLPPNIPSQPSGNTPGAPYLSYVYSTSTTDPDGDDIYYWFDWGDGSNSGWVGPYSSGANGSVSHYWSSPGTYQVKAKVKDEYGAENSLGWSASLSVNIKQSSVTPSNQEPNADFTYIPTSPLINETVNFTDASTDIDGFIVSWDWEFGDGTNSTEQNPSHVYNQSGEYLVNLTVTDNENATCTTKRTISVSFTPSTNISWEETTEITLKYNKKNQGRNYLVWMGAPINASDLAVAAGISNGESIDLFNTSIGQWKKYTVGVSTQADDFTISTLDIIVITCKTQKTIALDSSKKDYVSLQTVTLHYSFDPETNSGNPGLNYLVWAIDSEITASELATKINLSEEYTIYKYEQETAQWMTYITGIGLKNTPFDFTISKDTILCIYVSQEKTLTFP